VDRDPEESALQRVGEGLNIIMDYYFAWSNAKVAREAHALTLHDGPQLTRSVLSRYYWILQANRFIRSEIGRCVPCTKAREAVAQQQMDQLPAVRISKAKPSFSAGVDCAGSFWVRDQTGCGHKSYKAYICLFICMTTKAVHLELVSDLSSAAFIKALRHFVGIRG